MLIVAVDQAAIEPPDVSDGEATCETCFTVGFQR